MRNNVAAMLKALGTRLKKNNKNNNCSNSSAVEFQLILWIILNLHFTLATYIIAYKTTLRNDQFFFPYVVTVVCVKVWVFTQVTTIDAFTPHMSSARCQCNSAVFRYRVSSFFHESLVILVLCQSLIWVKCLCHDKFFLFFFSLQLLWKGGLIGNTRSPSNLIGSWPHFFSSVIQLTCSEMFTKVTHLKTNLPFFYPF